MYKALEQEHNGVPMLALPPEPEDLKKEPEPTAILLDVENTIGQGGPTDESAR
jgi:hypothetical protein